MPEHGGGAPAGLEQSGKHLQGGCFSRTVRTEKPNEFAGHDFQVDPIHSHHFLVVALEQSANGSAQARFLFKNPVCFAQSAGENGRFHG